MNSISELIALSERELEKNSRGTKMVGNRPHYPMLCLYNDAFTPEACTSIAAKLERIWPQALQHLVSYGYSFSGERRSMTKKLESALPQPLIDLMNRKVTTSEGAVEFWSLTDGSSVSSEELLGAVDSVQREHDSFASMTQLLVYNTVDTSNMESVADFERVYRVVDTFDRLIEGKKMRMLIVLLNDALAKKSLTREIKGFLAENSLYDSVVILSTRTRDNEVFEISELYRIVADLFILSNNDAVSSLDDADYKSRFATLYDRSIYTVSYVLCEKPNRKIAIQIDGLILDAVYADISRESGNSDWNTWIKKLEFDTGKSEICERFLSSLDVRVDLEAIEHLPLRESAVGALENIGECKFRTFCGYTYDDAVADFVDRYIEKALSGGMDCTPCVQQFQEFLYSRLSVSELKALDDATMDRVFEQLSCGTPNEELGVYEYFKRQIEIRLRRNVIYPQFKRCLTAARDNARAFAARIEALQAAYQKIIPLKNDEIGTVYRLLTETYLNSAAGHAALMKIGRADNDAAAILSAVFDCFRSVIQANLDTFSLPFIDEWERRLNKSGDRIYREISKTLTDRADDLIRLYGNLPIHRKATVYMLHTADADGQNCTKLFEHLQETFKDDPLVQYVNTGYDDALEAISLILCQPSDLLM